MLLKKVCIIGWGNIARYIKYSIDQSEQFELVGVVRRKSKLNIIDNELNNVKVVDDILKLGKVDIAILCVPEKNIEILTEELLENNISCINCCDDDILSYNYMYDRFNNKAIMNNVNIFHSFGFNNGLKHIITELINFMTDTGINYESLGPGIDMKYTSIVKNIKGVRNAVVFVEPLAMFKHSIKIYLEIDGTIDFIDIRKKILSETEFKYENVDIELCENVNNFFNMNMKYNYTKVGASSKAFNQVINFNMDVNLAGVIATIMINGIKEMNKYNGGVYNILDVFLNKYSRKL